jgi:hypothetical protein
MGLCPDCQQSGSNANLKFSKATADPSTPIASLPTDDDLSVRTPRACLRQARLGARGV